MEFLEMATVTGLAVLFILIVAIWAVKNLIIVVPPNRAAVITGRKRALPSGEQVGYRSVIGGRAFRIPIIESVDYARLETIPIEITVTNALSKGHIPLNVDTIANVKIASSPEATFNNAVERLLHKTDDEIEELAKEALMGALRGVVAKLTPEEVNEDRLTFAEQVNEEASEDLQALGFQLDVLKIQNVSDDKGYLNAIGRRRAAEAIRDAEIAEADAEAETREREAAAKQRAEIAEASANIEIAEARNTYRVRQAQLDQEGEAAERTSRVRAEQAEVEAQRELEQKRVEKERERYRAEVVVPAEAEREAAEERAKADAAPIIERGKAEAAALNALYREISEAGEDGLTVFMTEKLPRLLEIGADAVEGVEIDRLVVVDSGEGRGVANAVSQKVTGAYEFVERMAGSLGIDPEELIRGLMDRATGRTGAGSGAGAGGAARLGPIARRTSPRAGRGSLGARTAGPEGDGGGAADGGGAGEGGRAGDGGDAGDDA